MPVVQNETWDELSARLRSFVSRRVSDSTDRDDLAQEILLRLHRSLPSLRDGDRLDAFAYQIARNTIADHHRRARREEPIAPEQLDGQRVTRGATEDDDQAGVGRAQLARCLRPLIDRLDDPYREALLLTDLGELSQADAARELGLSEPGMRSRVQRGRSQLHAALSLCCSVDLDAADQISEVERHGPCACKDQSVSTG